MAELADAAASNTVALKSVQVRLLFPTPTLYYCGRRLTMKILTAVLLTLSFVTLASAATIKAFSVNNVVRVSANIYTAEKYIADTHGEANAGDIAEQYITFKTEGCLHNPAANTSAIYVTTPDGAHLIFSDGGTCTVDVMQSSAKAPAVTK
jgi:hypothetical protein